METTTKREHELLLPTEARICPECGGEGAHTGLAWSYWADGPIEDREPCATCGTGDRGCVRVGLLEERITWGTRYDPEATAIAREQAEIARFLGEPSADPGPQWAVEPLCSGCSSRGDLYFARRVELAPGRLAPLTCGCCGGQF